MEICAGTETVSAYSHKPPSSTPSEPSNSFLPALRHVQYFEMIENVKYGHEKAEKSGEVSFSSLSRSSPEQTLLQAGEVLMMSGPIADIRSNIPQHLAVTSPPTIKSSHVSNTGADLCALAHSQPNAFIIPQPLCDRQD